MFSKVEKNLLKLNEKQHRGRQVRTSAGRNKGGKKGFSADNTNVLPVLKNRNMKKAFATNWNMLMTYETFRKEAVS